MRLRNVRDFRYVRIYQLVWIVRGGSGVIGACVVAILSRNVPDRFQLIPQSAENPALDPLSKQGVVMLIVQELSGTANSVIGVDGRSVLKELILYVPNLQRYHNRPGKGLSQSPRKTEANHVKDH